MGDLLTICLLVFKFFYYWIESIFLFFIPRRFYMKDVKDDLVLITGAGSGIGRLLALKFSALGAKVILWDVDKVSNEQTLKLVEEQGGTAYAFTVDVTDRHLVYSAARKIKEEIGKVTILINNAGVVSGKMLTETPDEKIEQTFKINVISHFWTIKAFLPDMAEDNRGHVVCMASIGGILGGTQLADYCATKFATLGLQESLTFELESLGLTGVHTTTICPIFISTGMFDGVTCGVFPILDPEYVASRIVTAVRNNQHIVYIPRIIHPLHTLKTIIPWKSFSVLVRLLAGGNYMQSFVGHSKQD